MKSNDPFLRYAVGRLLDMYIRADYTSYERLTRIRELEAENKRLAAQLAKKEES